MVKNLQVPFKIYAASEKRVSKRLNLSEKCVYNVLILPKKRVILRSGTRRSVNRLKRNAVSELLRWKASSERKPLVIRGARQVGKTWLMKEFGKNYYQSCVY